MMNFPKATASSLSLLPTFQRRSVRWTKISEMMMCKDFDSLPIKDPRFKVMRPNSIYPRSGSLVTGIGPCGVHAAKLAAFY